MGKKSLIKSTTKKKADAKVEEEKTTKNAAAKKTKKTTAKSTKKTAAKTTKKNTTSTSKKSSATTAKKKAAAAAKKAAPKKTTAKKTTAKKATAAKGKTKAAPKKAKAPKKVSLKELVFRRFEPVQVLPEIAPAPKSAVVHTSAPPIIATADSAEADRLRALLFNKFDMEAIKAAAKEPAPAVEPVPEPEATAPTTPPSVEKPAGTSDKAAQPQANSAYITVEPQEAVAAPEPMNRAVKIALAAAAIVVFLLLAISYNNSSKYYIYPKDNAIEIWKGRFSPKDTQFFMVLHGTSAAEPIKSTYTKNEVFPLVFDYYIDKADTLLEVPGLPDFEGIKTYLHQAEDYIVSAEMNTAVTTRLNNIERMILLYKADVAISKDTDDALASAIKLLKKAGKLTPSTAQAEEIVQKIERARERRAELKSATKE